jgi:hypothetical protein
MPAKTTRQPASPQESIVTGPAGILAQASQLANSPERVRSTIVTTLIGQARSEGWLDREEEICKAAGYPSADDYWRTKMSEAMKALSFAHLLAVHQLDPTEQLSVASRRPRRYSNTTPFDPERTQVRALVDSALLRALEASETWFIGAAPVHGRAATLSDLNALKLHPRAAAEWLLSRPRWQQLVPSGLRAFRERSNSPPAEHQAPGSETTAEPTPGLPTALRTAIARRLRHGERPGDTVLWKEFCVSVRDECDGWADAKRKRPKRGFGDKSIQRLVLELRLDG